jgi:RimJ/RimL family protein N-acetyltransferase
MSAKETGTLNEELTKDIIIKGIINEINDFHLQPKEYINLASSILDLATKVHTDVPISSNGKTTDNFVSLPIVSDELKISKFNYKKHRNMVLSWIESDSSGDFVHSRIHDIEFNADEFFTDTKNIFGLIEADKKPIGIMAFLHFDKKNNKAELRKLIGENEYRGKGLGKKSTNLWLNYGLNGLKLRKIYLYTFDTNLRNIKINREMGFQLEGVFKQENIDNNISKDILRMAYLV